MAGWFEKAAMKGIGTESSPPNMMGTAPASRMLRVVLSISARLPAPSFGLVLRLPRSHTVWPCFSSGPPRSQSQWLSQSSIAAQRHAEGIGRAAVDAVVDAGVGRAVGCAEDRGGKALGRWRLRRRP